MEAELVYQRGLPPEAIYSFKHALIQDAAYQSLLESQRRELHGRIADVLVAEYPERAAAEPEILARHAEAAGRIPEAIAGYQRAGERARERSAYEEAIRHLRQAIALLATQPGGRERDAHEAALQLSLGHSFAAARGYGHAEIEAAYERARAFYEALRDARGLRLALYFLARFSLGSGQLERASVLLARVLAIAEETSDTDLALGGHGELGAVEYYQGKFASSLAHCAAALALHDEPHDLGQIVDRRVAALGVSAWDLWVLGWPDRALARAREAVALARQLGHPFSLAYAAQRGGTRGKAIRRSLRSYPVNTGLLHHTTRPCPRTSGPRHGRPKGDDCSKGQRRRATDLFYLELATQGSQEADPGGEEKGAMFCPPSLEFVDTQGERVGRGSERTRATHLPAAARSDVLA